MDKNSKGSRNVTDPDLVMVFTTLLRTEAFPIPFLLQAVFDFTEEEAKELFEAKRQEFLLMQHPEGK